MYRAIPLRCFLIICLYEKRSWNQSGTAVRTRNCTKVQVPSRHGYRFSPKCNIPSSCFELGYLGLFTFWTDNLAIRSCVSDSICIYSRNSRLRQHFPRPPEERLLRGAYGVHTGNRRLRRRQKTAGQLKIWGAFDDAQMVLNTAIRTPNMWLVLKWDNMKVVSIADKLTDWQSHPVTYEYLELIYVYCIYIYIHILVSSEWHVVGKLFTFGNQKAQFNDLSIHSCFSFKFETHLNRTVLSSRNTRLRRDLLYHPGEWRLRAPRAPIRQTAAFGGGEKIKIEIGAPWAPHI